MYIAYMKEKKKKTSKIKIKKFVTFAKLDTFRRNRRRAVFLETWTV